MVTFSDLEKTEEGIGLSTMGNQKFFLWHIKFELPLRYPSRHIKLTVG